MTGHNGQPNTLSNGFLLLVYYILFLPLSQRSVKMSCFVFVVNRRLFSEFFKLVSTYCAALTCEGLFCSYVVICTDVFGLRWCIFGCVSLLCFIHVYFLLSGAAAAVMELSRGEVPLYVSLTEQSSFFSPVSFSCSSCSLVPLVLFLLVLLMKFYSFIVPSGSVLSFSLALHVHMSMHERKLL